MILSRAGKKYITGLNASIYNLTGKLINNKMFAKQLVFVH